MIMVVVTELHILVKAHFTVCKSPGLKAKEKPDPANLSVFIFPSSSHPPLRSFSRSQKISCLSHL